MRFAAAFFLLLLPATPCFFPTAIRAESPPPAESARDALKRAVGPVVNVLSREPVGADRAFSLRLRMTEATNHPPELRGRRLEILCQPPDRLLWQFPALGTIVTVSRRGQEFWAHPASVLAPILERTETMKISRADQEPLAPLRLRVPVRLFWALFNLVKVREAGQAVPAEVPGAGLCHRVEMDSPDPKERGSFARLWLRQPDASPAQLDWQSPTDHATFVFESARFSPGLPESAFEPTREQAADLLRIPYARLRPFLKALGEEDERRQKAARGR